MQFQPIEVGPEWFDQNIPCMQGCPVLTNAGRYVSALAHGDDLGAYLHARAPNPIPSICGQVCAAPCELVCRRGSIDAPVSIRALKRYATEQCGVESEGGTRNWQRAVRRRSPRREQVVIVGAGPAGLACAHDLAANGIRPVILEAADRPGGMMVLGIPTYRLSREVLEAEIRAILDLGVELRTGVRLGRDVTLAQLRTEFDAVFLACGALRSRDLKIPGVELDGVMRAVEFLINANRGFRSELGERVVVIGGGNVALDAARTALRAGTAAEKDSDPGSEEAGQLSATAVFDAARMAIRMGARDVTVVSLEDRHEMPASDFEIEEALHEGVSLKHRLGPNRILGEDRVVTGLETLDVASVFDADGRFNPSLIEGSESVIPCDSVIMAIGQAPDLSWLDPNDGVEVSARGTIAVSPKTLATTAAGVFAGGDVAFGPRNLIDAVADGRSAAASISRLLNGDNGGEAPGSGELLRLSGPIARPVPDYEAVPRVSVPVVAFERRIGMPEVELGYGEELARLEAARCLQCFENVMLDPELCILCGGCVDACPEDCIRILDSSRLRGHGGAFDPASALVIQEDFCIRCGLCVARCPTGALWMGEWRRGSLAKEAVPA